MGVGAALSSRPGGASAPSTPEPGGGASRCVCDHVLSCQSCTNSFSLSSLHVSALPVPFQFLFLFLFFSLAFILWS